MDERTRFSAETLGQWLRILRGSRSQVSVEEATGVKQYTISTIESGKTERPSYEDVTKLAIYYGVTPDEFAALVGLFPLEDERADEENFAPAFLTVLREIRQLGYEMERDEQVEFATLLRGALIAQRQLLKSRQQEEREPDGLERAPSWLRQRLGRSTSAASDGRSGDGTASDD